jgi:hypothetical protein
MTRKRIQFNASYGHKVVGEPFCSVLHSPWLLTFAPSCGDAPDGPAAIVPLDVLESLTYDYNTLLSAAAALQRITAPRSTPY